MLTTTTAAVTSAVPETPDWMRVVEGLHLSGRMNVDDETLERQIRSAIRRQHPQLRRQGLSTDHVVLLGGGPSLASSRDAIYALLAEGAKLVTTNGAYHWAMAQGFIPTAQVLLDARATNARFVDPPLPRCRYLISSTCHPDVWDRLEGRENVWMFHPLVRSDASPLVQLLDDYYGGAWESIAGGSTVVSRALYALRTLGFLRFTLAGVDSCWLDGAHHAYDQPENAQDTRYHITIGPSERPDWRRTFECSAWHLQQLVDFLRIIRVNGEHFLLNILGDGLLAYALRVNADLADAVCEPVRLKE